ncbi:capsule biosynthesis GfcC family protein [Aliivibrio fischeri]|uniref:capsule biosynthesis GfcC family protein n=1 Tax=Aliivibrio fischeri TaxID=668 RepID=UPI003F75F71A
MHPRPTSVSFFGAIDSESSISIPFIEHASIDDYLDSLPLSSTADTSTVYVIQPDGVVQTTEFSVWQNKPAYLAPGASVYIPLGGLPSDFSSLNTSIVQLLRNKAL